MKFTVFDSGIGIPGESLDTIFDPLIQIEGSNTRNRGNLKRVPIIGVNADAMGGLCEQCCQAGIDGYISKPIFKAECLK